jgi:hypothetical protein
MENKFMNENNRYFHHWYFKKILDHIFNTNNNLKLEEIFKEISTFFGKEFSQQIMNNITVVKMFKFICEQIPDFEIYNIQFRGKNFLFFEEDSICSCNEKLNNKSHYFCQHYLFFQIMKKLNNFSTHKISFKQMNEIINLKYSSLNNYQN